MNTTAPHNILCTACIQFSLTLFVDTVSTGNILFVDTKKDPASSVADTKKDPASWEEVRRRYCLDLVHMGSTLPTSDCKLLLLILWKLKICWVKGCALNPTYF